MLFSEGKSLFSSYLDIFPHIICFIKFMVNTTLHCITVWRIIKFRSLIENKASTSRCRLKISLRCTHCYALHESSLTLSWRGYQFGVGSSQLNPDSWYVSKGSITSPKKSLCPNVSWFHMVSHSERVNISSNPILNWKKMKNELTFSLSFFFSLQENKCIPSHPSVKSRKLRSYSLRKTDGDGNE